MPPRWWLGAAVKCTLFSFFQIFKRRALKYKVKFKKKLAQTFAMIFYFRIKIQLEIVARHFGSLTGLCLQQHKKMGKQIQGMPHSLTHTTEHFDAAVDSFMSR